MEKGESDLDSSHRFMLTSVTFFCRKNTQRQHHLPMDSERANGIAVGAHRVHYHLCQRRCGGAHARIFGWIHGPRLDRRRRPSRGWTHRRHGRQVRRQCAQSIRHILLHHHLVYHFGILVRFSSQRKVRIRRKSRHHGNCHVFVTREKATPKNDSPHDGAPVKSQNVPTLMSTFLLLSFALFSLNTRILQQYNSS